MNRQESWYVFTAYLRAFPGLAGEDGFETVLHFQLSLHRQLCAFLLKDLNLVISQHYIQKTISRSLVLAAFSLAPCTSHPLEYLDCIPLSLIKMKSALEPAGA